MMEIVIVGASGFGRDLYEYLLDAYRDSVDYRIKGFLDDDPGKLGQSVGHSSLKVIGSTQGYPIEPNDRFLISIGNPAIRSLLADRLTKRGATFLTFQHPSAHVAESAHLDPGCIVGPFASVGSYASLGAHVLLNLYSVAGHDTSIGGCSVLSPHSVANGGSTLGRAAFLGSHAVITPNLNVGDGCKIAAGAVVYADVPAQSLVMGNPAAIAPLSRSADAESQDRQQNQLSA